MSKGNKETATQQKTAQQKKVQEEEVNPAPTFESVEDLKLNFPFALPLDINEGRIEEEAEKVKKALEEAHHKFMDRPKDLDDVCKREMDKIGSVYTLDHQIRLIGNSAERWLEEVWRWQEEERAVKGASAAELEEWRKSKDPLVKLVLAKPTTAPKPTTQPTNAARRGRKRRQVVLEEENEEESEEREEQLYVAELDTFVPVTLIELVLGDPAGNETPIEAQIKNQGMDAYLDRAIVPAGGEEQAAPVKEEEIEQSMEEAQLIVYRRRNQRREIGKVQRVATNEAQEEPAAPGGDEAEPTDVGGETADTEEQGAENETAAELIEVVA